VAQILPGMGARHRLRSRRASQRPGRPPRPRLCRDVGGRSTECARGAAPHRMAGVHRAHAGQPGGHHSPAQDHRRPQRARPGPWREAGWEFRALGVAEEAAPAGRLGSSRG